MVQLEPGGRGVPGKGPLPLGPGARTHLLPICRCELPAGQLAQCRARLWAQQPLLSCLCKHPRAPFLIFDLVQRGPTAFGVGVDPVLYLLCCAGGDVADGGGAAAGGPRLRQPHRSRRRLVRTCLTCLLFVPALLVGATPNLLVGSTPARLLALCYPAWHLVRCSALQPAPRRSVSLCSWPTALPLPQPH